MDFGVAFALGIALGFCVSILRMYLRHYEINTRTVLVYSAVTFAAMAIILVLVPSPEDKDALLAYIIASTVGFTMMGCSLVTETLAGFYTKR